MSRPPFTALLGTAALALLVLTGCAAPAPAETAVESAPSASAEPETVVTEQTASEACAEISRDMISMAAELQSAAAGAEADPESLVPVYEKTSTTLRTLISDVENADVADAVTTAADSLDRLKTSYASLIADPQNADMVELDAALTAVDTDFSAIDELCAA